MKYESIADIFSANQKIHEGLEIVLGGISPDEAKIAPEDGGWTIEQIVEHVAIVGGGVVRISSKLLEGARSDDKASDGSFSPSEHFAKGLASAPETKFEAPERVRPTGTVSLPEATTQLAVAHGALDALRPDMERLDLSAHTFPHPAFGELTAAEWLLIAGVHEMRHTLQTQRVLEQIRH